MKQKFSFSLRGVMFASVFTLTCASLVMIISSARQEFNDNIEQTRHYTVKLVADMASEFKLLVSAVQAQGTTLSLLADVQNRNAPGVEPLLADFLAGNPVYANILLLDQDGNVWASGIPLQGKRFSLADRKFFKEVMATGVFSPGEYAVGKTSGKPVMNFGHPVKDSAGKTVGCIAMGLNLEYFRQHFEKAAVPPLASFVFLDHRGVVLYRYLDPGKYIGTSHLQKEMEAMRTGPAEYTDVGAGLDGIRRIRASVRLSLREGEAPYLFIRAGIPYDALAIAARNKLIPKISIQICLLLLVFALLWYAIRHFILNPVEILRDAVVQVGKGDLSVRLGERIKVQELATVAPDFDRMVSRLAENIAERERAEADLRVSGEWHSLLIETSMEGFWSADSQGRILEVNDTYCRMCGYSKEELLTMNVADLEATETPEDIAAHIRRIFDRGEDRFESRHRRKDGSTFAVEVSIQYKPVDGGRLAVFIRDIADRQKAEEERNKLQEQLVQAQKMEVVGRLAGGVAHDFNNMLGIILGYTDILKDDCTGTDHMNRLLAIEKAALHSRDITRQLLAFSRKQLISPRPLDLSAILVDSEKMITRLMGEDITLTLHLAPDLGVVMLDPSQVDQILLNLAANARDAMRDGGEMVFTTRNVELDEIYCRDRPEVIPGPYVMLSAGDKGCGMDIETVEHIFEPFFTTKGVGEGTGLGLATIYGIVKQNNGHIEVASEPGKGTVFTLYFPRWMGAVVKQDDEPEGPVFQGTGTILVVEDEEALREMLVAMLKKVGYTVLVSASTAEALTIFSREKAAIDLLVSDIVMPVMNGVELQEKLLAQKPDLKTLFISGFPAEVVKAKGVLDTKVNFLPKPFTMKDLAGKISEIMGGG